MVCCPDCANQYVDSRRVYDNREIAALHCTGQAEVMNTRPLNLSGAKADTRVRSLVVHDSQFMLKILAQTLQQAGDFRLVGAATDAYQALRYVSAFSPELVLMGVHMPGLTGIHATRYIKQAEHSPVVILISSHNSTVTKSLAEQAGADGFVSTQGNFRHRLIRMLKNLLGSTAGRRVAANSVRFEDPLGRQPNQQRDK
jgi:DNA-binding NarL/FixJ family response regulator